MEKRHRVFIAINLPEYVKKELVKYYNNWPELPAKWTTKDNLHITLEFLGNLTDIEIADVCQILKKVVQRHKIFQINLNKIIYGPHNKIPPKMIWAEGEKSKDLFNLKNDLQKSLLEKVSFKSEAREFTPHITLARILEWRFRQIEPEEIPEINEIIDLQFTAESIEVVESQLKRGGPQYIVLESHNLNN